MVAKCLSPPPMVGRSRLRRSMFFLRSVEGPQGREGHYGNEDSAVEASAATEPMMVGVVIRRYWSSQGETRPLLLPTSCVDLGATVQR